MKKFLILICCLCLIGCKKNQSQNNELTVVPLEKTNIVENLDMPVNSDSTDTKNKVLNRTITNFMDSLTEEKYRNAYKDLVLSLWEKNDFILRNYDTIEGMHRYYKSNESFACNTTFVNNELLSDEPLALGMTKDDVLKLLGNPERSIIEGEIETIDYSYNMYVVNHNVSEGVLDASTGIEFFFDENKIITKIILVVEGMEVPAEYMNWED